MQATLFLNGSVTSALDTARRSRLAHRAETALHQAAAALLLLLAGPLMLLVAFLIWRGDGAPVLFGHHRVGRDGRLFRCLKFRTMRRDAQQVLRELLERDPAAREQWARDQKLVDDPRISRIGRFLRKTSLDELPQLINVLRGEMRLVGPRPVTPAELNRYGAVRWHYVSVHPGITGLWQVSGRNLTTYEERVELDRRYVERAGVMLDLSILVRTVWVVMTGHGAR